MSIFTIFIKHHFNKYTLKAVTGATVALMVFQLGLSQAQAQTKDTDTGSILATVIQSNGNAIEFFADKELQEVTMWETGDIIQSGAVFSQEEIGVKLSVLEAYLKLVPVDMSVPADLVRYSGLDEEVTQQLLRGRTLVDAIAEPIYIGDHLVAPPEATTAACSGVGYSLDWGPTYRNSGCNVDATVRYIKARICNLSNWGSIRLKVGHKVFSTSNHFTYPGYRTKDVAAGKYAYVTGGCYGCAKYKRRALYTNWDNFWEQAWVGGIVYGGSIAVDNCS
jgi:hypothetical protein